MNIGGKSKCSAIVINRNIVSHLIAITVRQNSHLLIPRIKSKVRIVVSKQNSSTGRNDDCAMNILSMYFSIFR